MSNSSSWGVYYNLCTMVGYGSLELDEWRGHRWLMNSNKVHCLNYYMELEFDHHFFILHQKASCKWKQVSRFLVSYTIGLAHFRSQRFNKNTVWRLITFKYFALQNLNREVIFIESTITETFIAISKYSRPLITWYLIVWHSI